MLIIPRKLRLFISSNRNRGNTKRYALTLQTGLVINYLYTRFICALKQSKS